MFRRKSHALNVLIVASFIASGFAAAPDPPTQAQPIVMHEYNLATTTTLPGIVKPVEISTTTTIVVRTTTTRASRGARRLAVTIGNPAPALLQRIKQCESHGDYTAQNRHSTASGGYQYLDSTWNHYDGYDRAMYAPASVQDQRAESDFARVGGRPWLASQSCWN